MGDGKHRDGVLIGGGFFGEPGSADKVPLLVVEGGPADSCWPTQEDPAEVEPAHADSLVEVHAGEHRLFHVVVEKGGVADDGAEEVGLGLEQCAEKGKPVVQPGADLAREEARAA